MHYRVQYEIDIDADTPLEAAMEADEIMRDPESGPPVLDVRDTAGNVTRVDLEDESEYALVPDVMPMDEADAKFLRKYGGDA